MQGGKRQPILSDFRIVRHQTRGVSLNVPTTVKTRMTFLNSRPTIRTQTGWYISAPVSFSVLSRFSFPRARSLASLLPKMSLDAACDGYLTDAILSAEEVMKDKESDATEGEHGAKDIKEKSTPSQDLRISGITLQVPSQLPSLTGSSDSGQSSEVSSVRTESAWLSTSGLDPPLVASQPSFKSGDGGCASLWRGHPAPNACARPTSTTSSTSEEEPVHGSSNGAGEDTQKGAGISSFALETPCPVAAPRFVSNSEEEIRKDMTRRSTGDTASQAVFTATSDWLGSKSDDFVHDYFTHKIKRTTKSTSTKQDGFATDDGDGTRPGSSLNTHGVGFHLDGSGPGFRCLVSPVQTASPIRRCVLDMSPSKQACIRRRFVSEAVFETVCQCRSAGELSSMALSVGDLAPEQMPGSGPVLQPIDKMLEFVETPSPMESLPSPVVLCSVRGALQK